MISHLSTDTAPLVGLLVVMLTTIALVWAGATLYFRRRDQLFWDRAEAMADEPMTDDERAAYEQYDKPPEHVMGLMAQIEAATYGKGPLDHTLGGVSPDFVMGTVGAPGERWGVESVESYVEKVHDRIKAERSALGKAGDIVEEDGVKYKLVVHPKTGLLTKISHRRQVTNDRVPKMPNLEVVMAQQSIAQVEGLFLTGSKDPDSLYSQVINLLEGARTQAAYEAIKAEVVAGLKELARQQAAQSIKEEVARQQEEERAAQNRADDAAFHQQAMAQASLGPVFLNKLKQPVTQDETGLKDARVTITHTDAERDTSFEALAKTMQYKLVVHPKTGLLTKKIKPKKEKAAKAKVKPKARKKTKK